MFNGTVVGNLGRDAEIKESKGGKSYLTFSVGVSQGWGDNRTTQWINVKKYGDSSKLAAILAKGTKVAVNGNLEVSVWKEKPQVWLTASDVHILSKPAPKVGGFDDVKAPEDDIDPFDIPAGSL